MSKIQTFLKEFKNEAEITRKMLKIVPGDKYDWQPHPRSMTIKMLVTHIAELPTWIGMTLNTSELDFAAHPYTPKEINNNTELMTYFEAAQAEGMDELEKAKEEQMDDMWTMRSGDQIFLTATKEEMLRITFCQIVHHRAQLGVFLRLLDIPIPGSYGPSADEQNF